MLRRLTTSCLTIGTLVALVCIVCQAQSLSPLTRHVPATVLTGQRQSAGRLTATQSLRLVLVLPLSNQAALDSFLRNLYDPSSPSYRQFLTVDQFTSMFGPSQDDYNRVVSFAETHGFTVMGTSRNRLNIDVIAPVASIEQAFHLTMGVYQHPTENRTFYAPDREPTPDLEVQLWHIAGLDNYSTPRPALRLKTPGTSSAATTGSGPSNSFLGSDMRAAYYGGTLTGTGQSLGLVEFFGTNLADLTKYYKNVGQTNNVPITLLSTDGTSTSCLASKGCDDAEQTLDMTQALGMAPGLSRLVVYIGSSDVAIFNAMATANPLNAQLSSSWGWTPADPSTDDPYFQEFAAQGQSLFQAAGDSGVWGPSSGFFPADDPYLTSVGGTDLQTSGAHGPWSSETAWADGGGGVSPNQLPIPSWQTRVAANCASCSQTYRNGPDVSANADFSFYVCANQTTCTANQYGGTSFAAPMWAGYMALVNEQAVANSGRLRGFINPTLYAIGSGSGYAAGFHDITSGSNGDLATVGYDLTTGWGSPNGSGLLNALIATPGFSLSAAPGSLTVVQGTNTSYTVNVTPAGGFSSNVTLSVSGVPSGASASFSPNPVVGGGSPALSVNTGTAAVGTYTLTISASGGGINHTTSVTLTIIPPPVSVSVAPLTVILPPGQTQQFAATVLNTTNTAVTWSLNPNTGMVSSTGLYTAPSPITTTQTVTITATSVADTTKSASATITLIPPPSGTVQFVKIDSSTQGSWHGIYGANGYNVIGATSALPSNVSVTPAGPSTYTWSSSTAAAQALQMSATSDVRLIAAWYGASFSLNVSFNDTGVHQLALYCLDPDGGRAQTINILDAVTGRVLDSRSLANFGNGQYLAWNLSGQVVISFTSTGSANAVVSGLFFDPPGGVATPAFSPVAGTYNTGQTVTISSATPGASIRYTTNGSTPSETAGTLYSGPITVSSSTTLNAIAYASGLADSAIAPGNYIIGGSTTAQFVTADTTTQGSWKGVYGTNGYNVIEDTTAYPSFVTVTPAGQSNYVWSWSSTSAAALQKAGSATDRIIAAWYGATLSLDVNFNDTATHRLALYCLDPDGGRAQTITIVNTATGATLDSRSIASFGNGEYLVWNLSGHVTINFTSTGSGNGVVSGLFF